MNAAVVIATYNEADSIGQILDGLRDHAVVVVDDASPDGTAGVAAGFRNVILVRRPGRMGLASAYVCGLRKALSLEPRRVVQMDAGLTHDPEDMVYLLAESWSSGAEMVTGSRFLGPHPFYGARTVLSLGAAWAARRLGVRVADATCGFRCWEPRLLEAVLEQELMSAGHIFQLEMLYHAWRLSGGDVAEVSIPYRLTNSSLKPSEILEGLSVWRRLARWED
jgi:dolichol-phosphate mannosyltransferase